MRRSVAALMAVPISIRLLITAVFVAVIVALSVTPDRSQPGDSIFHWLVHNTSTWIQKSLHVCAYAAIAGLLVWTLGDLQSRRVRLALALGVAVGLGATLEWWQLRVPGRFGSASDVLLDAIGAVVGLMLAALLF